jgi:DNA-binding transcriptional LysR family regulator
MDIRGATGNPSVKAPDPDQMPKFNLKHIEAFVHVADLGSFRRAASRLNTTQPNISNRISQLEQHLRLKLMDRDAGSVRLTREGRQLLGPARRILAAVDGFLEATGDGAAFDGLLRLGVTELVAQTWLRPFLMQMKDGFPAVDVELTIDLSENLSRLLFAREIDLTFQNGPFDQRTPHTEPLGQSPYIWVAAPALGFSPGPVAAAQIARHRILTHARGSYPFTQLDAHFRQIEQPVRLVPSSNIAACLQMACDGLGVACVPEPMVAEAFAAGRLQVLDYGWHPEDLRFAARWLVDPVPAFLSAAVAIARGLFPPDHHE